MQFHRPFIAALGATLFVIASSVAVSPRIAVAGKIFFSTSNSLNGTVLVGDPTVNFVTPSGSGTLYVWVTDDTPVTPPPIGSSSAAIAFEIARTGTSATMTGAQVDNFNLHSTLAASGTDLGPTLQNRWTAVSVCPAPDLEANVVAFVTQAGSGSPGLNPLNDGLHLNPGSAMNGTLDPGYDRIAHVFLHGETTYNIVGTGTTTFALQASPLGITAGSTNLSGQFTYGLATITVVPEPASLGLAAIGMIVYGIPMCRRRFFSAVS